MSKKVTFESGDGHFKVIITKCDADANDIECFYDNVRVGSVFTERHIDMVLLADALNDYIELRNLRKEDNNG